MSTPKSMPIALPERDGGGPIAQSRVLHILLGPADRVYLYQASEDDMPPPEAVLTTGFSAQGLRAHLLRYRSQIEAQYGVGESVFLVKATDGSRYGNLVDALDEMAILGQRKYALVPPTPLDLALLERLQAQASQ